LNALKSSFNQVEMKKLCALPLFATTVPDGFELLIHSMLRVQTRIQTLYFD